MYVCLYTVCLLTGYLTVATVAIEMTVGVCECVCDITAFFENVVGLKHVYK